MDGTDPPTLSRRRLLQAGGTGLAAATAGCVSTLPPLGSQVEIGRVDSPDPIGEPTYRRWVPAPEGYPDPRYTGAPKAYAPSAFEGEPAMRHGSIGYSIALSFVDYLGHDFVANDLAVGIEGTLAIEGPFDRESMATFLADTGYSPAGSVGGADLYTRPDGNRTLAVDDGLAIQGKGEESRAYVESHLSVGRGDHPRYHESNTDWAAFTDRVGTSPSIMFGWFPFASVENLKFSALSFRFDDQAAYWIGHGQVADGAGVPSEKIRDQMLRIVDDQPARMELSTDGSAVTAELRIPRSDEAYERPVRIQPQVMWGWEVNRAERTVTLRHEAGESFPAQYATIQAQNPTDRQFVDEYETVGPGDAITVSFPEGEEDLRIIYSLGNDSEVTLEAVDLEESP